MKLKHLYVPFSFLLLTTICVRMYQCLNYTDESWLVISRNNLITYITCGLFLLFFFIMFGMSYLCKNTVSKYQIKRNIFAGVFALLTGFSLVYNSVYQYISATLSHWNVVMYSIDALAGIVFIIIAISSFLRINLLSGLSVLALLPPLSICTHLCNVVFLTYPNLLELSEQIYRTLALIFAVLFLFIYAKLLSGYTSKFTVNKAMLTSLFCCSSCIIYTTDIAYKLITKQSVDMLTIAPYPSYLLLAAYSFCISVELSLQKSPENLQGYNESLNDILKPHQSLKQDFQDGFSLEQDETNTLDSSYQTYSTNITNPALSNEPKSEFYESLFASKQTFDDSPLKTAQLNKIDNKQDKKDNNLKISDNNCNKVPPVKLDNEVPAKRMLDSDDNPDKNKQINVDDSINENDSKFKVNKKSAPDIDEMVDDILKGLF